MLRTSRTRASCGVVRAVERVAEHDRVGAARRPASGRTAAPRRVQPRHVDHGEVALRVVDDDLAVAWLPLPTSTLHRLRAGDHVGVGHHPLGRVDEAGALDAPRAALRVAEHLHHRRLGLRDHRRVGQLPGSAPATSRSRVGTSPSNTRGNPRVSTVSCSASRQRARLARASPCRPTPRMIELFTDRASHGSDDWLSGVGHQPDHQEHGDDRDERAAGVVEPAGRRGGGSRRAAGNRGSRRRAWPNTASPKITMIDTSTRVASLSNRSAIQRPELQADQRATEESGEREQADDEPLPIAVEGKNQQESDEDEVDHASGHPISVEGPRSCPAGPRSGRSATAAPSHRVPATSTGRRR